MLFLPGLFESVLLLCRYGLCNRSLAWLVTATLEKSTSTCYCGVGCGMGSLCTMCYWGEGTRRLPCSCSPVMCTRMPCRPITSRSCHQCHDQAPYASSGSTSWAWSRSRAGISGYSSYRDFWIHESPCCPGILAHQGLAYLCVIWTWQPSNMCMHYSPWVHSKTSVVAL